MAIIKAANLACPLDGLALSLSANQYNCPAGHSFDIARQSYINLLPVQHKRSMNPGDSKEMIVARSEFLDSGVYAPIADRFDSLVIEQIRNSKTDDICLMDAGCGEGYYLQHLLQTLETSDLSKDISIIGLDISKPAIQAAARRSRQVTWLVASNRQPPVLVGSVDIIFCLFGFPVYDSFIKLLKPGGKIILLDAGVEHLLELRKLIYPVIKKPAESESHTFEKWGLSLSDDSVLRYKTTLGSNSQIQNLLGMTPHLYRASQEGKAVVSELDSLEISVEVRFRILEAVKPGTVFE